MRQILRFETPLPLAILGWSAIAIAMWLQSAHFGKPYTHASSVMCAYASIIAYISSSFMWMRSATLGNLQREWNVAGAGFSGIGAAFAIGAISFPNEADKDFVQFNADAGQGYGWALSVLLFGVLVYLKYKRPESKDANKMKP